MHLKYDGVYVIISTESKQFKLNFERIVSEQFELSSFGLENTCTQQDIAKRRSCIYVHVLVSKLSNCMKFSLQIVTKIY